MDCNYSKIFNTLQPLSPVTPPSGVTGDNYPITSTLCLTLSLFLVTLINTLNERK